MRSTIARNPDADARLREQDAKFKEKIPGEVRESDLPTRFGPNRVLEVGPIDAFPVVCLHAMRTGAPMLLSELGPLAERYRLIAPDLPGQSIAGPPVKVDLQGAAYADWLGEILDGLAIERVRLFGVSWGGFVARLGATAMPDRISHLALLVPAGIASGSHVVGLAKMLWPMIRYRLRPTRTNLRKLLAPLLTTRDEDWEDFIACSLRDWPIDPRIPPLASDAALRGLSMPTMVLAGDRDISFPGPAVIARVERLVPSVRTELLNDCRHCPPTTEAFRRHLACRLIEFFDSKPV
ncbi:MAG TPA: alpha/beta hydrolase [Planctomycetaceae bacterium]|nr:alpha/beta hydrolase [Planctomycetaceae bacterium]HRF00217.1 alpha/beta hydrolase [Pirellulaceae bacterium]